MFYQARIFLTTMLIITKVKDTDTKRIISLIIINFFIKKKMVILLFFYFIKILNKKLRNYLISMENDMFMKIIFKNIGRE